MSKNKPRQKLKSSQWHFVDTGLDDFRGGAPSPEKIKLSDEKPQPKYVEISKPPIINNEEQEATDLKTRAEYLGLTKKPENRSVKLSKKQAVFSKKLPKVEQREEYIEAAENHLKAHPLALYPHLLDAVPVDLVENVSHLLESDLHFEASNLYKDDLENQMKNKQRNSPEKCSKNIESNEFVDSFQLEIGNSSEQGPSKAAKQYRWLVKDEDKNKPIKTTRELQEEASKLQLENVTSDFAKWANELSDSTPNVDPQTIKNLFASGYETKPALTVPIQVYELSSLPQELRITEQDARQSEDNQDTTAASVLADQSEDEVVKDKKYGAWYIAPKSWNNHYKEPKKDPNKALVEEASANMNDVNGIKVDTSDPNLAAIEKVRLKREMQEQAKKKKNQHVDEHEQEIGLASLHAARAFREFLENQQDSHKMPEFMNKIYQLQDEIDRNKDERKKIKISSKNDIM